ncbi:MAG: hypothetical protein RL758_1714 [Pseudomonadota bacterium]|jgi:hypothetical protein
MQDLVVLVADKNMQFALQGALARPQAVGIRPVTYEFRSHMGRDGGVRTSGAAVLAREAGRFRHALMLLDFEGCGQEDDPLGLESELDRQLHAVWGERAKAIVISPEVDVWLWGADNALREALHWPQHGPIRDWLQGKGFEFNADGKPLRPKEALDAMRPVHKQPRSSALYEKITGKISLQKCTDPAFIRLRTQLEVWFGC